MRCRTEGTGGLSASVGKLEASVSTGAPSPVGVAWRFACHNRVHHVRRTRGRGAHPLWEWAGDPHIATDNLDARATAHVLRTDHPSRYYRGRRPLTANHVGDDDMRRNTYRAVEPPAFAIRYSTFAILWVPLVLPTSRGRDPPVPAAFVSTAQHPTFNIQPSDFSMQHPPPKSQKKRCETKPKKRTGDPENADPPEKTNPIEPKQTHSSGCPIPSRSAVAVGWVIDPPSCPASILEVPGIAARLLCPEPRAIVAGRCPSIGEPFLKAAPSS
jgi:hypothetical protein